MLFDIGLAIWICLLKHGKQEQINKWDCIKLHQTKKLLHSEEDCQQNEKASYWIEDSFTNDISNKGLIKYTKNWYNSSSETTNWAKNGQMTWADIYTQKEMASQPTHEKMLNITNDQGHACQNDNEILLYTWLSEWLSSRKPTNQPTKQTNKQTKPTNNKCWQECGQQGNPSELLMGLKIVAIMKNSIAFP